jgi:hypothetical protein
MALCSVKALYTFTFNVKMNLQGIDCDVNWIELAQDCSQRRALILAALNLRIVIRGSVHLFEDDVSFTTLH